MKKKKYNLIVILGPTASGKTSIATRLAAKLDTEIISADSRQVFKGMDIGTGKDLDEFIVNGKNIPHHLIDIIEPTEEFSVYDFQNRFYAIFEKLASKDVIPILVGGTGLYIDSILRGYTMQKVPLDNALRLELEDKDLEEITLRLKGLRPDVHNTSDILEKQRAIRALEIALYESKNIAPQDDRPEILPLVFGTRWDRQILKGRITKRLKERLESGLIEEVQRLHRTGISWEKIDYFGLEYRFIGQHLQGKLNRNDMVQKLNSAIHKFAKRQETWFRRMERHGVHIHWLDEADYEQLSKIVANASAS